MIFFCVVERKLFFSGKLKGLSRDIFLLNFSTTLAWVGYFLGLKELEPAIVSAITLGFGPLITGFLLKVYRPRSEITGLEKVAGMGILFSMFYLAIVSLTGQSAVTHIPQMNLVWGILFSFVGAMGIAGNTVFSKRISDAGFTATQIMSVRFFLLLAVCGIAVTLRRPDITTALSIPGLIAAIAIFGTIVPLYLLQRGIGLSEPMVVSLILPLGPVIVTLFQQADPRLTFSVFSLLGVILVTLFSALGTLNKYVKR